MFSELGVVDVIRILQVIGVMNRGGAETMLMNIYRNIDRSRIQFDFVVHTEEKGAFDDEIKSLGGNIFHCPKYNGKNHFEYIKWWNDFFEKNSENFTAVHGHIGSTASMYLSSAKKYSLFTIAHSHNTDGRLTLKNRLYKLISYSTRNIADYFFACSYAAGKDRYGVRIAENSDVFTVLKNAVDTERFLFNADYRTQIRQEFNISDDKIVVGHIGRFNLQKNHSFLVDIAYETIKINRNVVFMLVGGGDLENDIKNKVTSLGISDNVLFTGIREDTNKLYQAFDLFLFPSFFEGLPVTLVEAQTSGLTCLVSDTITKEVSLTDLIHFMSIEKSASDWADALLGLISSGRKNTKQQIVSSGYDINTTSKWLENFYTNIKDGR